MKKLFLTIISILFFITVFSQIPADKLKIIMLGFGAKNPILNENEFPNLKFYYSPKLKLFKDSAINKIIVKGKPKILEEWWEKQNLQYHAILFDKNGNGAWEGNLNLENNITNSLGFNETTFCQALDSYIINGNVIKETNRDFIFYSSNSVYRGKYFQYPFVERKMAPFYVYDKNYNAHLINEIIEYEKPVVLIFFYLDNLMGVNKNDTSFKTLQLFNNLEQLSNSNVYKNYIRQNN